MSPHAESGRGRRSLSGRDAWLESAETWPRATYLVLPFALALYLILKTSTEVLLFSFLGFNLLRVNTRFLKTEVSANAIQEHHGRPPSSVSIPRPHTPCPPRPITAAPTVAGLLPRSASLAPSPAPALPPEANHSHTPLSRFCPQTHWKNPDAGKD